MRHDWDLQQLLLGFTVAQRQERLPNGEIFDLRFQALIVILCSCILIYCCVVSIAGGRLCIVLVEGYWTKFCSGISNDSSRPI